MIREGATASSVANEENKEGMCGARGMRSSGVERPACPYEHRSLLVEIDDDRAEGLAVNKDVV